MTNSNTFIKILFVILSLLLSVGYTTSFQEDRFSVLSTATGLGLGVVASAVILLVDRFLKGATIKGLNILTLGLLFGYLLGEAILHLLFGALSLPGIQVDGTQNYLIEGYVFLFTAYLGIILTKRAAEDLSVSLPFVTLKPSHKKKKEIFLDASILLDPRLMDLALSGLLDQQLIVPRFILKEFNDNLESSDETLKAKGKRGLEILKKLESIASLELRYLDADGAEGKDSISKLIGLAKANEACILTAELSRVQQSAFENVKIINIHLLSNALKPITQAGEYITVKIQRYGNDPRQGVGYLEDGTMVVVNGGADYIGDAIKAQVLSVKNTHSGRMIFCNISTDTDTSDKEIGQTITDMKTSHKNYFAL